MAKYKRNSLQLIATVALGIICTMLSLFTSTCFAKQATGEMIGCVGLLHRTKEEFDAPFMPATEIGWRLSSKHWNKGYATEAASAVLEYGFTQLGLDEIVSFTVVNNKPSRRIMEKIGLHHNPKDDFDHPKLATDSPLRQHVLYRLTKNDRID